MTELIKNNTPVGKVQVGLEANKGSKTKRVRGLRERERRGWGADQDRDRGGLLV